MPRLPKNVMSSLPPRGASPRQGMPNPRMMAMAGGPPKMDTAEDGAPPMPRYNARALRPGGMAKGGSVKGMTRGDGITTRGHTRGKMV